MHVTWLDKYFKGDRTIWLVVFILTLYSLLAVYSSTGTLAYKYKSGNTEFYLFRQLAFLASGIGIMYAAHLVKYTYYSKFSMVALAVAVPLLVLTLLFGTHLNEASRWLTLPGIGITFQTSDLAKLALIMFVARMLSRRQDRIKEFRGAFVPIMIPVILVCVLIFPANLSTTALLMFTCCLLMFIGRIRLRYILLFAVTCVAVLAIIIGAMLLTGNEGRIGTWKARIENFRDGKEEGNYQAEQAKIAIAEGGLLGKFPGNSSQRNFLPHPYSDFIYAIIIEEYGLVFGGLLILFLYMLLFFRVIRFIHHSPRAFGTLLAIGCSFSLVFQAMINMAVAVNLFPVTGQPLPLVSMGGTSTLFTSLAIGIILSVSREIEKEKREGKGELKEA
jgi:cell division protein FtsW